jgi:hypothetical protein
VVRSIKKNFTRVELMRHREMPRLRSKLELETVLTGNYSCPTTYNWTMMFDLRDWAYSVFRQSPPSLPRMRLGPENCLHNPLMVLAVTRVFSVMY